MGGVKTKDETTKFSFAFSTFRGPRHSVRANYDSRQTGAVVTVTEYLPPPEEVARRIAAACRERELLRRLYRLSLDARDAEERRRAAGIAVALPSVSGPGESAHV